MRTLHVDRLRHLLDRLPRLLERRFVQLLLLAQRLEGLRCLPNGLAEGLILAGELAYNNTFTWHTKALHLLERQRMLLTLPSHCVENIC